jgi:hypothetical protein
MAAGATALSATNPSPLSLSLMMHMKYVRKNTPLDAIQITKEIVLAHLIEREPLPLNLRIGHSSHHPERRELHSASLWMNNDLRCSVGDWIVGPTETGSYSVVGDEAFREHFEPAA